MVPWALREETFLLYVQVPGLNNALLNLFIEIEISTTCHIHIQRHLQREVSCPISDLYPVNSINHDKNILVLFQVSKWETTKWRPWIQRGVHPRGWWAHRGISTMGALLFDLGGHNKRKKINSTYCLILEQLGWGCGQLWWYESPRGAVERNICLWIWEAICYSAESHYSLYKR